ncbi:MAG: AAA family ATPase [Phenylobacterium sp.]|jgi:predicted kinase|uniref:AAA family ATPase n=1 Tax=Phenylobacterium ferrooxidans TaxID=2982689 RepID=A0ABW6CQT4_9CAUL|nr:AAA family ATPase [Phenylobacterium sp.]MDO8324776.1 AAA family ATPase [Phenylobacterium sp.]MDO8912478.1 AAA family ATPase [Phenylobacterium sp.]MDO9245029.1 AAA family ATPase [Phenylobacterium sp.]MDP2011577.1 AAA family ATPase [Phenylobacterium sp.]MDP3102712.1 AAA family ATPase [Phenylobacterium sp.]
MTATLHVIFGPSGAGKSTYAKQLARTEPAIHFAIDDWMARLFAADMPEPLEFEWMMSRVERCEAQIWSVAAAAMAAGTSVVLDLGLMRKSDRARVAEIAEACELPLQFHFVTASSEIRRARVLERNEVHGETFAIEVNPDMFDFIEGVYEAPDAEELRGAIISES